MQGSTNRRNTKTRSWLRSSIAIMLILGGTGAGSAMFEGQTAGQDRVSANEVSSDDDFPYDHTEYDNAASIKFSSPEEALVGKYVDLKPVEKVAVDSKDKNESVNYQVKKVYVHKDEETGKLIADYIGGQTNLVLSANGSNNSIHVYSSNSQDNSTDPSDELLAYYYTGTNIAGQTADEQKRMVSVNGNKQVKTLNNPVTCILPAENYSNHYIKVSYRSNSSAGGSGQDVYFTTEKIEFTEDESALKKKVDDFKKKAAAADAAKKAALAEMDSHRKQAEDKINNNGSWDDAGKKAQIAKVEAEYKKAEDFFNDVNSKTSVDPDAITAEGKSANDAMDKIGDTDDDNPTLDQRLKDTLAAINKERDAKDAALNDNPDLTHHEIDNYKGKYQDAADTVYNTFTDLVNNKDKDAAQKIEDMQNTINPPFDGVKIEPKEKLANYKAELSGDLKQMHDDARDAITNSKDLKQSVINKRLEDLEAQYKKDTDAVNAATKTTEIEDVKDGFANEIKTDEAADRPSEVAALEKLFKDNSDYDKVLEEIKSDTNLDEAEKQDQLNTVSAAWNKFEGDLNTKAIKDFYNKDENAIADQATIDEMNAVKNAYHKGTKKAPVAPADTPVMPADDNTAVPTPATPEKVRTEKVELEKALPKTARELAVPAATAMIAVAAGLSMLFFSKTRK